jgi:hypothetical protein
MNEEQHIPSYFERMKLIKLGLLPKEAVAKIKKPMRRVSDKKRAEDTEAKEARGGEDTQKEKWFLARRKEMVSVCQCGCGQPSQKKDDMYFRHSAAHIFPKAIFESVMYHKLNWVERRFWGGCHTRMDEQGMDKWPNMADWEDIKEKFHQLAPLLTDQERATKFYSQLEKLVYGN